MMRAARLHRPFVDGDDLHSPGNKHKMASGIALDDADRAPWLDAIADTLSLPPVIVACSALKRAYRDRLRKGVPDLGLIYLEGARTLLARRLAARSHEVTPRVVMRRFRRRIWRCLRMPSG
jgi:gluconokinase